MFLEQRWAVITLRGAGEGGKLQIEPLAQDLGVARSAAFNASVRACERAFMNTVITACVSTYERAKASDCAV